MDEKFYPRVIALVLLGVLVAACFRIVLPFLGALTWATIIAVSAWPLFVRLRARLGGRSSLAAGVTSFLLLLIFVLPVVYLTQSLAEHVQAVSRMAHDLTALSLPAPPDRLTQIPLVGERLAEKWREAGADLGATLAKGKPWIAKAANWVLSKGADLGLSLLEFLMAVLISGVLLHHGEAAAGLCRRVGARLSGPRSEQLLIVAEQTVRGVSIGVIGTALIQAVLTALGLLLAGVPGVGLLGFLSFLFATLQIGTGPVWIPAAVWLGWSGQHGWMIFTIVWGLFINVVDNFIRPYLIGMGNATPMMVIFLGVLGGMLAWGFIGIFVGATLLAAGYTLFYAWLEEASADELNSRST
jgi:predicted PurR-regulated permease PerM